MLAMALVILTACSPVERTKVSKSIGGHHLETSILITPNGHPRLVITLSNSSDTVLVQESARAHPFPPNLLRVYSVSRFGREVELALTGKGTNAELRGELWIGGRYSSRPIKLEKGQSTNWTYHIDELFQGMTKGKFRIEFIPSGIDGFHRPNLRVPHSPFRHDLASSNLFLTL